MNRPVFAVFVLSLLALTGCGRYYWTQPGRGLTAFEADSQVCLEDIRAIKYPVEPARIYRVCMAKRGWQRAELAAPAFGAFRGAESEEEALGLRPIVQPDSAEIEAALRAACQERIRNLILRPRSAYAEAYNRCLAEP